LTDDDDDELDDVDLSGLVAGHAVSEMRVMRKGSSTEVKVRAAPTTERLPSVAQEGNAHRTVPSDATEAIAL
jgi:hypothetical protein